MVAYPGICFLRKPVEPKADFAHGGDPGILKIIVSVNICITTFIMIIFAPPPPPYNHHHHHHNCVI